MEGGFILYGGGLMLSVVETLQLAIDSFNSIKAAIEEKGVQVGDKPKSEYSILISQIKSDTSDLEAQIENLQGQVNRLSSQVEQLTNEKNSLSEQVGTLTSQNSTLQSSLDSQTAELRSKTATLSTYTGYLKSIGENIKTKGGTITENDFSTYAGGVLTISSEDTTKVNELQTQVNELTSQVERLTTDKNNLNTIINTYKTIFANIKSAIETKGGTVGEDYTSYAQAILNLNITGSSDISDLQNQVNSLTNDKTELTNQVNSLTSENNRLEEQVSSLTNANSDLTSQNTTLKEDKKSLNTTISNYKGYFADIKSAIEAKGSTVTNANDYSSYAQGIMNIVIISSGSGSGSSTSSTGIEQFKTELIGLDFDTNAVIKITNANNLFSGCSKLRELYGDPYLDLSNCNDVTDMFKGCSSFSSGLIIKNFGNNVQKDLILDLSECQSIDLDNFKDIIVKYTGTYVRKIILDPNSYSNNVDWGGVAKLKSKGIQVVSA